MESRNPEFQTPIELWFIILSFLPVKTLLRFRAVSKSFLALIDDPNFFSFHLRSFPANRHESHLFVLTREKFQIHETAMAGTLIDSFETGFRADSFCFVHGSINGLVLLSNVPRGELLLLWNPSTRKKRWIPLPSWFHSNAIHLARLGYDHLRRDYKVLFLQSGGYIHTQHGIYSASTGSWKTLDNGVFGGTIRKVYPRASFNGGVAWVELDCCEDNKRRRLVLFDFGTERECYAALPSTSSARYHYLFTVIGGHSLGIEADGQVWELDMEKMTWTSLYKIGVELMPMRIPAARKENRELVFWTRGSLKLWSYNTKTMVKKTYEEVPQTNTHNVGVHVESLVKL